MTNATALATILLTFSLCLLAGLLYKAASYDPCPGGSCVITPEEAQLMDLLAEGED